MSGVRDPSFARLPFRDRVLIVRAVGRGRRVKREDLASAAAKYAERTVAEYRSYRLWRQPWGIFDQPLIFWPIAVVVIGLLLDQGARWWLWTIGVAALVGLAFLLNRYRVAKRVKNARQAKQLNESLA